MIKKFTIIMLLLTAFLFAGCAPDTGPVVISVDKTPEPRPESITPTPEPTKAPTPSPTATPTPDESFAYIEDLDLNEEIKTMYFSHWGTGSNEKSFRIEGQDYNKGIGMYVRSRDIEGEKNSISATWALDREYHKISFDLGCEETLQYDVKEKYGTYQITVYADGDEIWDSQLNDYKFTAIGKEIELPEGTRFLTVTLTQTKGINGTLNVVMGSFKLYYY